MRVENTNIVHANSKTKDKDSLEAHFHNLFALFSEATNPTYPQSKDLFTLGLKKETEFFTSFQSALDLSDPSLYFKDQVISSKALELIEQALEKLEKATNLSSFKVEILKLYLIEAFFYHPTHSQTDLLHLAQTSALFNSLFSDSNLSFALPSLQEVQSDAKTFAENIESQKAICTLFHELMPHQPTRSEKSQISILHQDLFQATFLAKMVLNQIQQGQKEHVSSSTNQLYQAYALFLEHLALH